jgi:serine/threonine protein phosphatase PrpC
MAAVVSAYGRSDKGRIRPTNEDCFAIEPSLGLFVVADGMGGHNAGEVAARIAVDAVVAYVAEHDGCAAEDDSAWPLGYDAALSADGNLLRTAIHLANLQILEAAFGSAAYAGMGTTIVAARVTPRGLTVAHVGDSRLYVLAKRRLRQVTADDSWVAALLARIPELDPDTLAHHPLRNVLTNVVGARPRTEVHVTEEPLAGDELLLLSTDGVHGVVDDAGLMELLSDETDPGAIAKAVVAAALMRGSRDNCTAVVARCGGS